MMRLRPRKRHTILIVPIARNMLARNMYERRVALARAQAPIVVFWYQQIYCANDIDYYI